ncbi:autotransporter domain-containing protein [Altererythrobacter arenosus]|uniref:Autotransporter domain-containing protein n=1 Tax=Altererythrobacter arenosus TaxID=3032592 RepID=A0ABY8FSW2_9SPHN|nr:autotransporter domain-containing protein [Altererythrobacter sp. CAU 1644]WFL78104.1 autotransporter domain-containing protein [Altererythrobacter sp. CAU 1644]
MLTTVGVIGLGMLLAQAPANAANDAETGVAAEAQGSLTGINSSFDIASIEMRRLETSLDLPVITRDSRAISAQPVAPHPEIIVRDDVGLPGSVDVNDTVPYSVQIFRQNNLTGGIFFNCTGTLINPRTILTAAHCVNSRSSEAYGLPGAADNTMLISTGIDSAVRLFNYIGGATDYASGGIARSTDVVIHPSANIDNGGLEFPWADVAFIALDTPITDTPSAPILLTPLDQLTHVVLNGYGTFGTGDTGDQGIGFLRLVGENMLGAIASNATFIDQIFFGFAPTSVNFGVETQTMYFTDFDNPNRTPEQQAACEFNGFGISCADIDAVKAIDWFDGDALPNEVATAPGDSGSALIVDELYGFPVVAGVLSGGYDFFDIGNAYGDVSFYNPLFPFFEFITENTSYKYVSALSGDGDWSDPSHWTQDLDPGFFIDDGTGTLVNGIPEGSETGVYTTDPTIGTILGNDVTGAGSPVSPFLPPEGTPNFGGNLPESSALLGPGSTGFVPNNTDGTPGVAFAAPAQYFEVHLNRAGTTSVDIDVEIDKLVIDNVDAGFVLQQGQSFDSLIGVEQFSGLAVVDGVLTTPLYLLAGGELAGDGGTIRTDVLFNVNGLLSAGGIGEFGSLTIDGNYVQTSGGAMWVDFVGGRRNQVSFDYYDITGTAILDGFLVVSNLDDKLRFGTAFTALTAGELDGEFSDVVFLTDSPVLTAGVTYANKKVIVQINARAIKDVVGQGSDLASLATTLDSLRFGGRYTDFQAIFDVVDTAGFANFGQTLLSLTPTSGFAQSASATNFATRFTGHISQRTLALRGANDAAAGFSNFGSASFAQAGAAPSDVKSLSFFGSVSGSFLKDANARNTGAKAFEEAAFTEAGELTIGADYKLNDNVSFGMAVSNILDGSSSVGDFNLSGNRSLSVAGYGAVSFGKGFADMYVGFSEQRFGLARGAQGVLEEEFRNALGVADGTQTLAGLRLGYGFEPAAGVTLGPVASVDYVRSDLGGYEEFGAGSFGLRVQDRTFTSIGAKLGGMASADLKLGNAGTVTAFGSVAYARELGSARDVVTAHFVGAEDLPFNISRQLDPEWVSVNAGAKLSLSDRLTTEMSLTSDMGRGVLSSHQANLTLLWAF